MGDCAAEIGESVDQKRYKYILHYFIHHYYSQVLDFLSVITSAITSGSVLAEQSEK